MGSVIASQSPATYKNNKLVQGNSADAGFARQLQRAPDSFFTKSGKLKRGKLNQLRGGAR